MVGVAVEVRCGRGFLDAEEHGPVQWFALNLYSHDAEAMRSLTAAVLSVYDVENKISAVETQLDAGGSELVAGLTGAYAVRAILQQALGVTMALTGSGPHEAYAALRLRAAEDRIALTEAAGRLISGQRW